MGKLNMDTIAKLQKQEEARSSGNFSNIQWDKLKDGANIRRILWPKGDSESFFMDAYYHYRMGQNADKTVLCPKTFDHNAECPICAIAERLRKIGTDEAKQMARNYSPKRRVFMNVIDRDSDPEGTNPKVLGVGPMILKQVLDTMMDVDYGDITDYATGRDITIKRKGKGLDTEYSVLPRANVTPASTAKTEEQLEDEMSDFGFLTEESSKKSLEEVLPYLSDPTSGHTSKAPASKPNFNDTSDNLKGQTLDDDEALQSLGNLSV